jgi:hypothetical protein
LRTLNGTFYKWLVEHNFPPRFRTLCMNCNFARGIHGYCPHEVDRHETTESSKSVNRIFEESKQGDSNVI